MENIKITISGELGSGKTVLSKHLCEKMDFIIISVGGIQRELAEKYGMTTLEFNQYMETHPEIDIDCDQKVVEYGLMNANLILDSRLAWHFVPHAFKIHLIVDINTAGSRIFNDKVRKNEQNNDLQDTINKINSRKASERKRFKEQYGLDIDNFDNYDLVIDSSHISPENLANFVIDKLEKWKKVIPFSKIWLSPKNIDLLQNLQEEDNTSIENIKETFNKNGINEDGAIEVIKSKNKFYLYHGHELYTTAVQTELDLIPAKVLN